MQQELRGLVAADQADREGNEIADLEGTAARDLARTERVLAILAATDEQDLEAEDLVAGRVVDIRQMRGIAGEEE